MDFSLVTKIAKEASRYKSRGYVEAKDSVIMLFSDRHLATTLVKKHFVYITFPLKPEGGLKGKTIRYPE